MLMSKGVEKKGEGFRRKGRKEPEGEQCAREGFSDVKFARKCGMGKNAAGFLGDSTAGRCPVALRSFRERPSLFRNIVGR